MLKWHESDWSKTELAEILKIFEPFRFCPIIPVKLGRELLLIVVTAIWIRNEIPNIVRETLEKTNKQKNCLLAIEDAVRQRTKILHLLCRNGCQIIIEIIIACIDEYG